MHILNILLCVLVRRRLCRRFRHSDSQDSAAVALVRVLNVVMWNVCYCYFDIFLQCLH